MRHLIKFVTLCGITIPCGKAVGMLLAPWFM